MGKAVLNMFLLSIIFWSFIVYDISSHGTIESSRTGRLLNDTGLLLYVKPYYLIAEEQTVSLYKWYKSHFPYREFDLWKNKTLEITKYIGHGVSQLSSRSISAARVCGTSSYNYIATSIPPDFTDKTLRYITKSHDVIVSYCKAVFSYSVNALEDARKWTIENVSKDKMTWETVERSYFRIAQKIGIYYSNVTNWVGRKVECLISA